MEAHPHNDAVSASRCLVCETRQNCFAAVYFVFALYHLSRRVTVAMRCVCVGASMQRHVDVVSVP